MSLDNLIPAEDKLLAVCVAVVVAFAAGAGTGWMVNGWRLGKTVSDMSTEQARISAQAEHKHSADLTAARTREQALQTLFELEQAKRLQGEKEHEKTLDYWRARARAGTDKLRIAVARGSLPGCAAAADPAAASGTGDATPADVVPAVADAVLRIAADDGRLVRDYNRVIGLYNAARTECNKPLGAQP